MDVNSNIPQGRGMIKWAPFATMPEQYENVGKLMEQNTHVPAPALNLDLLQELELRLREYVSSEVVIRYWINGHEVQLQCLVMYIDDISESVIVAKEEEILQIPFKHIYEVNLSVI